MAHAREGQLASVLGACERVLRPLVRLALALGRRAVGRVRPHDRVAATGKRKGLSSDAAGDVQHLSMPGPQATRPERRGRVSRPAGGRCCSNPEISSGTATRGRRRSPSFDVRLRRTSQFCKRSAWRGPQLAANTSSLPFLEADLRCDSSGWPKTVRDFVEQAVPAITSRSM